MTMYNHNVVKSLVVYEVECLDCGALNEEVRYKRVAPGLKHEACVCSD